MSILNFRNIPEAPSGSNKRNYTSDLWKFLPGPFLSLLDLSQHGFQKSPRNITDLVQALPYGKAGSALNQQRPASIEDIISKLESLQNPDRYSVDPELLKRQAMATASAQYDPVIAQLRNQMGLAQTRAERNKAQLGSMFEGLSQSLTNDIAPIQQQYQATEQKTADQYTQLQNQLKSQYSDSQAEQEAMLRRLNIEAAAPDVFDKQTSNRDMYLSNAATESQNVQSQLAQQEGGAVNYTRQGAELARTEGTNRQADLMNVLSDYLTQSEGQIGANEAAKNQTYLAQLAGLQGNSQKDAIERAQRDFENYIKVIGVMQSLQPKQGQAASGLGDVAGRALGLGLDTNSSQAIQNVFMSALSSDPIIQSGLDPTFGVSLTKEALANRIVEAGRQQGLGPQQINALQQIALEYFGRR